MYVSGLLRFWKSKSILKAGELADHYVQARGKMGGNKNKTDCLKRTNGIIIINSRHTVQLSVLVMKHYIVEGERGSKKIVMIRTIKGYSCQKV